MFPLQPCLLHSLNGLPFPAAEYISSLSSVSMSDYNGNGLRVNTYTDTLSYGFLVEFTSTLYVDSAPSATGASYRH